jgi:hypothetical protein
MRIQKDDFVFVAPQQIESLPIHSSNGTHPTPMLHHLEKMMMQFLRYSLKTDSARQTDQPRIRRQQDLLLLLEVDP